MKQRFLVVYEHCKRNYGGFAPDIPGCISTGKTLKNVRELMREALNAHLEWMAEDGDEMPKPVTTAFDFAEFADESVDHYVVEWLEIEVPETNVKTEALAS
jgi:predicted RNase H-like HicB family nuclease